MTFVLDMDKAVSAARRVELLLMDCDGVMTDGRLYFTSAGEEMKVFHVRDGQGIAAWHAAGFHSGIISGRGAGPILECRARELGISHVLTCSKDKAEDLHSILGSTGLEAEQVAFIGDDVGDLPVLSKVGFPVGVADCAEELHQRIVWKTSKPGGHGAVRELVDFILAAKSNQ